MSTSSSPNAKPQIIENHRMKLVIYPNGEVKKQHYLQDVYKRRRVQMLPDYKLEYLQEQLEMSSTIPAAILNSYEKDERAPFLRESIALRQQVDRAYMRRPRNVVGHLAPHPFDLKVVKRMFDKEGLVSAGTEETCDGVLQPGFNVDTENERAKNVIEDLVNDPDLSFYTFQRAALADWYLYGDAYIVPRIMEAGIYKLDNLPPYEVWAETDGDVQILGYWHYHNMGVDFYPPDALFHWKRNAHRAVYGNGVGQRLVHTVKRQLDVWLDAMAALRRYGAPFIVWIFGNAETPEFGKTMIDDLMVSVNNANKNPNMDAGIPFGVDVKTVGADFRVVMNFLDYIEKLDAKVAATMKVPFALFNLGKSGQVSVQELEMFDKRNGTRQRQLGNLDVKIFRLELGLKNIGLRKRELKVRWNRFDRIERDKKEQNLVKLVMVGVKSPNEARQDLGMVTKIKAYDPVEKKIIPEFGDHFWLGNSQATGQGAGQTFPQQGKNQQASPTPKAKQTSNQKKR